MRGRTDLIDALTKYFEGHIAKHKVNINNPINNYFLKELQESTTKLISSSDISGPIGILIISLCNFSVKGKLRLLNSLYASCLWGGIG